MNGFLGFRGTFMLDFVVVSMFLSAPLLLYSFIAVRMRRAYQVHKSIQMILATVLLLAVVAFEFEMRLFGWQERAAASGFWVEGSWNDWVDYSLAIHLLWAIPTPILWCGVLWSALRGFPHPPSPTAHSKSHRFWGRLAMVSLLGTAITGWAFYVIAFVA